MARLPAGLMPKPRNFQDAAWQKSVSDEHIEQIVQYGGAAVGKSPAMPANPDLTSKPEVVAALRAHVRALASEWNAVSRTRRRDHVEATLELVRGAVPRRWPGGALACGPGGEQAQQALQPTAGGGQRDRRRADEARGLSEADVTAALKTYMPTGKKDDYYLFSSGGQSGQVIVIGIPSMRILKYIAVFTPEPWQGWGYGDQGSEKRARGRRRAAAWTCAGATPTTRTSRRRTATTTASSCSSATRPTRAWR